LWLPLSPPLLPYTTLFRSRVEQLAPVELLELVPELIRPDEQGHVARMLGVRQADDAGQPVRGPERMDHVVALQPQDPPSATGEVDRKSTRLNSSHQIISYA